MRSGTDVSLVAFGKMVGYNLKAAELLEQEGISCEVINLRSLKPIDRDALRASIRKTHRLVAVEEGWPQCGVASGARARGRRTGTLPACGPHLRNQPQAAWRARVWLGRSNRGQAWWPARPGVNPAPPLPCGLQRSRPLRWRSALTTWMRRLSG
jgi:hypothetical protein